MEEEYFQDMENNLFNFKFPEHLREFRYENMFLKYKNPRQENCELFIKNIEKNYHFHIYKLDRDDPKSVITVESHNGQKKKHIDFNIKKFLELLGLVFQDFWMKIEIVDILDPKFVGKKIKIIDMPANPTFNKIKRDRTAYFVQEFPDYYFELYLIDLDAYKHQMGVIENEEGKETDLLFTRNGEVLLVPLTIFDEMENVFKSKIKENEIFKPIDNFTSDELEEIIHSLV